MTHSVLTRRLGDEVAVQQIRGYRSNNAGRLKLSRQTPHRTWYQLQADWIQCLLGHNGIYIAQSDKFLINIWNRGEVRGRSHSRRHLCGPQRGTTPGCE